MRNLSAEGASLSVKRTVLRTGLGRYAVSTRDAYKLVRAALRGDVNLGTMANDQLASFLVARLCAPARTFIDVGAHIGSVIEEVMRLSPTSRIVAIEAMPDKAERLRRMFPRIEVHACAVSETEGQATFFVNMRQSGFSSLQRPSGSPAADVSSIMVPLRRLDALITSSEVDAIKIDVEGAELGVLRGAEKLVADSRPTIMFESGPTAPDDSFGYTKQAMWQWFADREFAVLVPNRVAHDDPGLTLEGFVESHLYPRRTTNYVAVPRERRIEVRDRARVVTGVLT